MVRSILIVELQRSVLYFNPARKQHRFAFENLRSLATHNKFCHSFGRGDGSFLGIVIDLSRKSIGRSFGVVKNYRSGSLAPIICGIISIVGDYAATLQTAYSDYCI